MKSLSELQEIRNKTIKDVSVRNSEDNFRVVVGMATCGIAAGARPVMNAFLEEVSNKEIKDCSVSMTGCIGMCTYEPIVEVIDKEGNKTTYVHMNAEKAKKVVAEHLIGGKVVREYLAEQK